VTSLERSATGKLFHATGPLTAKLLSPYVYKLSTCFNAITVWFTAASKTGQAHGHWAGAMRAWALAVLHTAHIAVSGLHTQSTN